METESKEKNSSGTTRIVLVTLIIIWIFCHLLLIYWQVKHWQIFDCYEVNEQFHINNLGYMIRYVGLSALWIIYGLWAAFVKDSLFHKLAATGTGLVLALAIVASQLP